MAVVSFNVAGHFYRFSCNDGQEARMKYLAGLLNERAQKFTAAVGVMSESQLLMFLCLTLQEHVCNLNDSLLLQNAKQGISATEKGPAQDTTAVLEKIQTLTKKVQDMIESLPQ